MSILWDSWYPCTDICEIKNTGSLFVFWKYASNKDKVIWLSLKCHVLNFFFLGFSDPENDDDSRKKGSQSYGKKYDPVNAVMDKIDAELSSMVGHVFFSILLLGRVCLVYM